MLNDLQRRLAAARSHRRAKPAGGASVKRLLTVEWGRSEMFATRSRPRRRIQAPPPEVIGDGTLPRGTDLDVDAAGPGSSVFRPGPTAGILATAGRTRMLVRPLRDERRREGRVFPVDLARGKPSDQGFDNLASSSGVRGCAAQRGDPAPGGARRHFARPADA